MYIIIILLFVFHGPLLFSENTRDSVWDRASRPIEDRTHIGRVSLVSELLGGKCGDGI